MKIPFVECVEVELSSVPSPTPRKVTSRSSTDFAERRGYLARLRHEHLKRPALDEAGLTRQVRDFSRNGIGWAEAGRDVPVGCRVGLQADRLPESFDRLADRLRRIPGIARRPGTVAD